MVNCLSVNYVFAWDSQCIGFNILCYVVVIIDPGIKTEQGYSAYDDGMKEDIFLKVYSVNFRVLCCVQVCMYGNLVAV